MKSFWFILLPASLFSKSYCSIESNVGSQPSSLLKSVLTSLAKWQIAHSLKKEPFLAYNKLNDGILEIFGTAFDDEVTSEKISFLQKVTSNFRIQSVVFKWFYFDEKMLRIFDAFHKKLQNSVKSISFEKCSFPETFVITDSLELNSVSDCSFNQCFANEGSLKEMFKVFKNAPVISLRISKVFDYKQCKLIDSNIALKRIAAWSAKKRLLSIFDLKLDSFFSTVQVLSLTHCSLDFAKFSLTSLQHLNYVDLSSVVFENFQLAMFFKRLPLNVKRIKFTELCDSYDSSFIGSAFDQKVVINADFPFQFDAFSYAKALSVFSSLHFNIYRINDKMTDINEYVEGIGGVINTVTSVRFITCFNYESIKNMITILRYFPNLDDVEVRFMKNCDASINDGEILKLYSDSPVKNVKKLSIYFNQKEETSAFYRFIVELMKLCQTMLSLEFHYETSNLFATNIKEIFESESIQFTNLDTFEVDYSSKSIDVLIDLFYVATYNIKNLTMDIIGSMQNSNGLDQFKCFSVATLHFKTWNARNFGSFINKLFTKFQNVTSFSWDSISFNLISTSALQNMKRLKKAIVGSMPFRDDVLNFLKLLPHDLESLEIDYYSNAIEEIEEIERVFYEKYPVATLTVNVL